MSLDKKQRLTEKREAEKKRARAIRLEPPFPWKARPFDPSFFGLRTL